MAHLPSVNDAYFDSEELMSWLLLNPEMGEFDIAQPGSAEVFPDLLDDPATSTGIEHNTVEISDEFKAVPFAGGLVDDTAISAPVSGTKRSSSSKSAKIKQETTSAKERPTIGKKRQRESVEDIEARVNELRSENADLQAHLMNVTQRTTEVQKQRIAMEKLMVAKLTEIGDREDADQSELAKVVKQYTDIYADYGKCRQREVSFHLNQLEKLLCPTKTTKLSLWALQQDKSFFQKSKSPMFNILSKELELTPEQTEKIQERRDKTGQVLAQLQESLSLIATLKTAIEKKHACYDGICGRVQEAASPKQTVLFLKWISAHAEELAKYIPSFSRSVHHMPNVEFVEGVVGSGAVGGIGSAEAVGTSSSSSRAAGASASNGNGSKA